MQKLFPAFLLIIALVHCSSLFAMQQSAVVLMYHHFGDDRYPSTNIRLDQFEQQLEYLERQQFHVLPLQDIVEAIRAGQALPDKTIAITMDDAYRSVYSEAYPRLKLRGWPFTVFVSTDYIDKGFANYLTWEQMREMEAHDASFGNHSRSHDFLVRRLEGEDENAWRERVRADIEYAGHRLQQELDNSIPVFAYPYGEYSLALAEIVAKMKLVGMGQHSGAIGTMSDIRFLPRFPMAERFADMEGFTSKISSLAMPLELTPAVEPVIDTARPVLHFKLDRQQPVLQQLTCYASGQGRIETIKLNDYEYSVQASMDLPPGRSRYNCTAPSGQKDRYYWFSQPWIRPGGVENESP